MIAWTAGRDIVHLRPDVGRAVRHYGSGSVIGAVQQVLGLKMIDSERSMSC